MAQYVAPNSGGTLGDQNSGGNQDGGGTLGENKDSPTDQSGSKGATDSGTGSGTEEQQQVSTGGNGSLPFTGFAILSIALAGAILLAGGVAGRRTLIARS